MAATTSMTFNAENLEKLEKLRRLYPTSKALTIPVLWLAQNQFGWISPQTMKNVADEAAGNIRAHLEVILADRAGVEHRVEGHDAVDMAHRQLQQIGDVLHRLG